MVPLIVRSAYSLMMGVPSVERLCREAAKKGYRMLALTDRNNLYGLWPFINACDRSGITPIIGAEITERDESRRVVCLVENDTGYRNLCGMITKRRFDPDFSLKDIVSRHSQGLTVLVFDPDLLTCFHNHGVTTAAVMARTAASISHPLIRTAKRLGIPYVAAPDSCFLEPSEFITHRCLRAIAGKTSLSRLNPNQVAHPGAWLASCEEYEKRFSVCPEAIRATHEIAERLTFRRPDFGLVMPPWNDPSGATADEVLKIEAYAGAKRRYGNRLSGKVIQRLEYELDIISRMTFSGYFLVVREIVRRSPRICGRGSGAASLVAYCLGITNICPIRHNLYFERFLNPGRKDPPDIDVDFAWDERDAILDWTLKTYKNHSAMVSTHILFQPRMAVREIARVSGIPEGEIGAVTKRIPHHVHSSSSGSVRSSAPDGDVSRYRAPWPNIFRIADRIIGIPRCISVHPGGVVITPEPIHTYVPVEKAPKGVPVIQWEKDGAEDAGLVKIDLLGNRSLGVIRDAVENIRSNGIAFDEETWDPEDDPETRKLVANGLTMGCFYIESPSMRLLQEKTGKGDFEHVVIHSSIIRPAANSYIREYIRRVGGGEWKPIHPLLADVLKETYGIMVYQEDVSRTAVAIAGFSHADADGFRKILSKKDREHRLADFRKRFFAGALEKGISPDKIEMIWKMMMSFDGYSFCKPHSASYARVSFQTAFLKAHYPAEFLAAVISNQGGYYSRFAYVSEAKRIGVTILPPSVNRSDIKWTGSGKKIRVGLMAIRDLKSETRERIIKFRKLKPYLNARDFFTRVSPDTDEATALIHSGALDDFSNNGNRASLFWDYTVYRNYRRQRKETDTLFSDVAGKLPDDTALPVFPPDDPLIRFRKEFAVLGFLCRYHPIEFFNAILGQTGTIKAVDLRKYIGKRVMIGACMIAGKTIRTSRGDPMEFTTFEDETGIIETTFFPDAFHRYHQTLKHGSLYVLTGIVEEDYSAITVTVESVHELKQPATPHL